MTLFYPIPSSILPKERLVQTYDNDNGILNSTSSTIDLSASDQLPKDPIKLTGETVLMSNASDGKLCTDTFRSESDVCHEYPVPTADGEEV